MNVRIVDQCPECPQGNIDLSPQAFAQIAALPLGIVPIKWKVIPYPAQGTSSTISKTAATNGGLSFRFATIVVRLQVLNT